jgi:hypothetical protein
MGNGPHTLKTACFDAKKPAHGHSHRRAPGRRPRDQVGQPIDCAAACQRRPGTRPARTRPARRRGGRGAGGGRRWPGGTRRCRWSGWVSAWWPDQARQASTRKKATGSGKPADRLRCSVPAPARISTSSPTWPAGCWRWLGGTRRCWWAHPAVAAAGQRGAGPDRPACRRWPGSRPGRRCGRAGCWWWARSPDRRPQVSTRKKATGSARPADRLRCSSASAGQELDQFADVAGWVLVSHCTVTRKPGQRPAAGPSGSGAGQKFALSYRNQREQVTSLRPPDNRHY